MTRSLNIDWLMRALEKHRTNFPLNLRIYHDRSSEATAYAHLIYAVAIDAGFAVEGVSPFVYLQRFTDKGGTGVTVADEPADAAASLCAALNYGGVSCGLRHVDMQERQGATRFVGTGELLIEVWPE